MRWQTFRCGFGLVVGTALIFNVLSVYNAWFPGCADCVVSDGTPFPSTEHGGFFTETFIKWRGVRDDLVAIVVVAVLGGLVSMQLFRTPP